MVSYDPELIFSIGIPLYKSVILLGLLKIGGIFLFVVSLGLIFNIFTSFFSLDKVLFRFKTDKKNF